MDELHLRSYKSSAMYKEKINAYHDENIENWEFTTSDKMLLFESKIYLFPGKLKSNGRGHIE